MVPKWDTARIALMRVSRKVRNALSRAASIGRATLIPLSYVTLRTARAIPILALALVVVLVTFGLITELYQRRITVTPIDVPPGLTDAGVTGRVASRRLTHGAAAIANRSPVYSEPTRVQNPDQIVDLEVPGGGVSTRVLSRYADRLLSGTQIGRFLGIDPSPVVIGEVLRYQDEKSDSPRYRLRLRFAEQGWEEVTDQVATVDALLEEGSWALLRLIEPERAILAHLSGNTGSAAKEKARHILESLKTRMNVAHRDTKPSAAHEYLSARFHYYGATAKYKEALRTAERLQRLNPDHATPYIRQGWAFQKLEEWEAAEAAYKNAIERDPSTAVSYNNLGLIYASVGSMRNLTEAKRLYERALAIDPTFAVAYMNIGDLHYSRGEWSLARDAYESSLLYGNESKTVYLGLGASLHKLAVVANNAGRYREALRIKSFELAGYREGLRRHPEDDDLAEKRANARRAMEALRDVVNR